MTDTKLEKVLLVKNGSKKEFPFDKVTIDESYNLVVSKLTKKEKSQLALKS